MALAVLIPSAVALMQTSATAEPAVPNTTDYLLLGLAIVVLIAGVWIVRLIVRFRTLRQDALTLEALEGDSGLNAR